MLTHGERSHRKLHLKMETESGRVRRVFSVTAVGETVLKEDLKALILKKRIADSLLDYYKTVFGSEG